MKETVIFVENVSKIYKMYDKPSDRLKEVLSIKEKSKHYNEHYALNDISFKVEKGEIVGILGPNGAGKSTILKIITGLLTQTSGEVNVKGKVSAILELGAGFNPEFTGLDNIALSGTMSNMAQDEVKDLIKKVSEFSGIGEYINYPVKTYSSGMFARLAFSVAINMKPDILIVDEALSVGDLKFQQKSLRKMKELIEEAKAILFVSHDTVSIRNLCTRALWIMDGKVYKDGSPKVITRQYDDYMSHGILPSDERMTYKKENYRSQINQSKELYEDIDWQPVKAGESIGGKDAYFSEFAFLKSKSFERVISLNSDESLSFFIRIKSNKTIEKPLIGFGIFNEKGQPIIHFNSHTQASNINALEMHTEVVVKIDFTLPLLRNGVYFISVGLDEGAYGKHNVVHRLNELLMFKINSASVYARQHGVLIVKDAYIQANKM